MAVTIRDVARKCGLSISAVSKALNNYPDVSEETRQRVIRVAAQIGYYPNALARGLKTNQTLNLGVILEPNQLTDSLTHPHFLTILTGFKREAERQGYDITLINHNIGGQSISYLNHCRYRNVDGVCVLCMDFTSPEMQELARGDLPLVTIDHLFEGRDCVQNDNLSGMRSLMAYILGRGHRDIAFIHGGPSVVTDVRLAAYYGVMRARGIEPPPGYVIQSLYQRIDETKEAVGRLLALPRRPTCIIMPDDFSCLGGIEALQAAGLRVPEDISVAGYDGIAIIQRIHPRMTTICQSGEEMGRLAALRLLARIEAPKGPVGPPDVVAGQLLEGETVREITAP